VGQGKLLMYRCENERCQWNATEWPVQVTSNGTIPLTLRRPKHFNKLPDDGGATMRSLEAQLLAEQQTGGGEINSRYR
jgi:hypothetical protein